MTIWKCRGPRRAKTALKKSKEVSLPDFWAHCETTVVNTV